MILGSIWFSHMTGGKQIGIVLVEDEYTKKQKAYIGIAQTEFMKEIDEKHIAKFGGIFPVDCAKQMIGNYGFKEENKDGKEE